MEQDEFGGAPAVALQKEEKPEAPLSSQDVLANKNAMSREDKLLGERPALLTILLLSVGPLCSQISNTMYGLVSTIWLKNTVSELATTALSAASTLDSMPISFGFFFMTCSASQLSAMFGMKEGHKTGQVLSDLLRFCIIAGVLVPAIFLPCAKPLMYWFGSSDEVVAMGFDYLVPIMCGTVITCWYLLLCGCLQAEGRTFLFGLCQICAMVLNAAVFNPLFLMGFKNVGIRGSALSVVFSQLVPTIGLMAAFYSGKFTTKPKLRDLWKRPIPETWNAVKTGASALLTAVSGSFPGMFFQKFMGDACESQEIFNNMMSMYNAYNRIIQIVIALFMAFTSGYLPAASYAFTSLKMKRVMRLTFHCFWLVIGLAVAVQIIVFTAHEPIAKIFSSNSIFLDRFQQCLIPFWCTVCVNSLDFPVTALLQATQWHKTVFVVSIITQLLTWPVCSVVMKFAFPGDEVNLFYAFVLNDGISGLLCIPLVVLAGRSIYLHTLITHQSTQNSLSPRHQPSKYSKSF